MKTLIFFFAALCFPLLHYAQDCTVNAGGSQNICVGDQLMLNGEMDDYLSITWSVIDEVTDVYVVNPNSFSTLVLPETPGQVIESGYYTFRLTAVCIESGTPATNDVTIYVGEIQNLPQIENPFAEMPICQTTITLFGSVPDPGVTALWTINTAAEVTFFQVGNDFTISHSTATPSSVCDYTVTYTQSIGSCSSSTSVDIHFSKDNPTVDITYVDPSGCPTCSQTIRVRGTDPGCDTATPSWSTTPSAGVIFSNQNGVATDITFPNTGVYDIEYNLTSQTCSSATAMVTCEIGNAEGFEISQATMSYSGCLDEWETPSFPLAVPYQEGVEYSWEITNNNLGSSVVSLSSLNTASSTLEFNGTPIDISNTGMFITVEVTATFNGCEDKAFFFFNYNQTIFTKANSINLLCGGDPQFRIWDIFSTQGIGTITAQVLAAPAQSPYQINSIFSLNPNLLLNLTVEGTYIFEVTISRTFTDPQTGITQTCSDSEVFTITVADYPSINAGSDIITCLDKVKLIGNTPLNSLGEVLDIPLYWEQSSGPGGVTILNTDSQYPIVCGLQNGQEYKFKYYFSNSTECEIVDEVMVTVLPVAECELCELEITQFCAEGCVIIQATGASTYSWSTPNQTSTSFNGQLVLCNNEPGPYLIQGFKNGIACGAELVTPVSNPGGVEVVYMGCIPHQGAAFFFELILPDFPVVDVSEITVIPQNAAISNLNLFYNANDDLILSGVSNNALAELCFTIYEDELCPIEACIPVPGTCPLNSCNCIYYLPQGGCYSDENSFGLTVNVIYYTAVDGIASEIVATNLENPGEISVGYFSDPSGNDNQFTGLEFYGTDLNNDGLVTISIQIFDEFGGIICEDLKTFSIEHICSDPDLLTFTLSNGAILPDSFDDGKSEKIEAEELVDFLLFPNPANDLFYLNYPVIEGKNNLQLQIIDISGKLIQEQKLNPLGQDMIRINDLPDGIFIINVFDQKQILFQTKLVHQQ